MKKILIVSHNQEDRRILAGYTKSCGFQPVQLDDVTQAETAALEMKPAVMLLDPRMPNNRRMESLENLREKLPGMTILSLCDEAPPTSAPLASRTGESGYLARPYSLEQFRRIVDSVSGDQVKITATKDVPPAEREGGSRYFTSPAEYIHAFQNSNHGDLSFVPVSMAAEYLGMTSTGVTQLARRGGGMSEIVVDGPTKKWIGVELCSLIQRRESVRSAIPDLAARLEHALERLATERRSCGLLELMRQIDIDPRVPQNRHHVHEALAFISARTFREKRFLLSAVCALTSLGKPSNTFLVLAQRLGALRHDMDRGRFYQSQLRKVFNHYRRRSTIESMRGATGQ